jgi:hypothetical protein
VKVPSLKATAVQSVADDVERLLASGRLSREQLEARLEAEDLRYLEEKLSPTTWVPLATYGRLIELLIAAEGQGQREAYLIRRGERSAERLSSLGIYSQLDATTENLGNRIGTLVVTVAQAIYNVGRWSYEPAPTEHGFVIRVHDAAALPEISRLATQGFVQYVARRVSGQPLRVISERPTPDLVVFRAEDVS